MKIIDFRMACFCSEVNGICSYCEGGKRRRPTDNSHDEVSYNVDPLSAAYAGKIFVIICVFIVIIKKNQF